MANFLEDADIAEFKEDFDQMIREFGKTCVLIFPPKIVDCDNCNLTVGGNPKNIWRHGGPTPIAGNLNCGLCSGSGKISSEVTEEIKMIVNFASTLKQNLKDRDAGTISMPKSIIESRGFIYDLPKIINCLEMELQPSIHSIVKARYRLLNSPTDFFSILSDRYFMATWERIA